MSQRQRLAEVLGDFARTMLTDFPIEATLDRLVARMVDVLPITGAGVTLISDGVHPHHVAASNDAAMRAERLQSDLGEGPCLLAYRTGEPVSVVELAADGRFPTFGPKCLAGGVSAVFTFPLGRPGALLGAVDLYRDCPGPLGEEEMEAAQTLADVAAAYLLNARARGEPVGDVTKDRFAALLERIPAAVYEVDLDGIVLSWNPAAEAIFGWSEAEAVGRFTPFVAPEQAGESNRLRDHVASVGRLANVAVTRRRRDGVDIELSLSAAPMRDVSGSVVGMIGIASDVTQVKRQQVELAERRRSDRQLAAIVSSSGDAIISSSVEGVMLSWNDGAATMFGYSAAEILGRPLSVLARPGDRDQSHQMLGEVLAGRSVVGREEIRVRKDGSEFPVAITVSPVWDGDRVIGMSGVVRDITAQKNLEATLEHRALHDELTGLANRTLFVDRLALALARLGRRVGRVTVIFIDIDRFKVINDSLGHELGDQLLVMVAERLVSAVRPSDTVARFSGDEFVVLCESVGEDSEGIGVGERIQQSLSEPFDFPGRQHWVSVSAGIAVADRTTSSAADLLRDADAAMYQAKRNGRACSVVFTAPMRAHADRLLDVEMALHQAIAGDELRVHYQPIVSLRTGRVDSVEALVRWQHPTEGLLGPNEFIGIAEQTGLVVELGEWVLRQACQQAVAWSTAHPELAALAVSVNLSGRQLTREDLVSAISGVLADTRLDPGRLVLEITESVLLDDVMATLEEIKALGVSLSIDDFGTGYSSLSYLKRFPVDFLKIDKSFVDGLGRYPADAAVVTAIVALASGLGITTVAEGVETAAQLAELVNIGCDKAQGHLFCAAKPSDAIIAELLADHAVLLGVTPVELSPPS